MGYDLSHMVIIDRSAECDRRMYGTLQPGYKRMGMLCHATACRQVGGSSEAFLLSYHAPKSSADQLIRRDGSIVQLMPPGAFSYHSGESHWEGITDSAGTLNMPFYGVEIENTNDGREPYTHEQIVSAAATYAYKCALNQWPNDRRIAKHYEVATSHVTLQNGAIWVVYGRKSDPANFPWGIFWQIVWGIRADWPVERFGIPLWVPPNI